MLNISIQPTRIPIPGNPCIVEIIPKYGQLAYEDVFGIQWKDFVDNEEELEKKVRECETIQSHPDFLIIHKLKNERKIKSIDNVVFLHNIETPVNMRKKGYGKDALTKFEQLAKGFGVEYILCCVRDGTEHLFIDDKGFEKLEHNYWGKQLS